MHCRSSYLQKKGFINTSVAEYKGVLTKNYSSTVGNKYDYSGYSCNVYRLKWGEDQGNTRGINRGNHEGGSDLLRKLSWLLLKLLKWATTYSELVFFPY